MPGLFLYQSNKLEVLAQRFYEEIAVKPLSPMQTEYVMVQSIGMGRWLSLDMSERGGVWANCKYLYPNVLLDRLFSSAFDDYNPSEIVSKTEMQWKLFSELPLLKNDPLFEPLKGYCEEPDSLKLFQLSGKIADLFDQYITGRPDMVCGWDDGKDDLITAKKSRVLEGDELWQSALWRRIITSGKTAHRASFRKKISAHTLSLESLMKLPKRLSVFGASTLLPFHLDLLEYLSAYIDVRLYVLSPSREYIVDIIPESVRARTARKMIALGSMPDEINFAMHPLVSSLGALARDFQGMILDRNFYDMTGNDDFTVEDCGTLLSLLQHDIVNLINGETVKPQRIISQNDRSVSIHRCFGPVREVESVHDFLLDILNTRDDINPRDILVMATDIDKYAPYIESVFGGKKNEGSNNFIPYSIADRNVRRQSVIAGYFEKILTLGRERYAASVVLDILGCRDVKKKFALSDDDMEIISQLLQDSGIRWGLDAKDREKECGFAFSEHSWEFGIQRLLLGYAEGGNDSIFEGMVAAQGISGSRSESLGSLLKFFGMIRDIAETSSSQRTPSEWKELMLGVLESFFAETDENEWEFKSIREALHEIVSGAVKAEYSKKVSLAVMLDSLMSMLDTHEARYGFLNGRVTFCAMLPMRSIPFKVICILGLDDGAFPGSTRLPAFDLMGKERVRGDRSKRNDDRYIFLESIISTRDFLYMSYNGKSPFDNSIRPPSVVLRELEDYISRSFCVDNKDNSILKHICYEHRLHSFSSEYFDNSDKLFGYDRRAMSVAEIIAAEVCDRSFSRELPARKTFSEEIIISLSDLCNFFRNPSSYFCKNTLAMSYPSEEPVVDDIEPFKISFSDSLLIESLVIDNLSSGRSREECYDLCRASGMIPPGMSGVNLFDEKFSLAESLAKRAEPFLKRPAKTLSLDERFNIDGFQLRIRSEIENYRDGIVKLRGSEWGQDLLTFWIEHLAASTVDSLCESRFFLGKSKSKKNEVEWMIPAVDSELAKDCLKNLSALYINGLSAPLEFFPNSSREYAKMIIEGKDREEALSSAMKKFLRNNFTGFPGEGDNEYIAACFNTQKNNFAFSRSFEENALSVFEYIFKTVEGV